MQRRRAATERWQTSPRVALRAGSKAFEIETYGEPTSYLARPYPEQSRQMIQRRIADQLTPAERSQVDAWLEETGLTCFAP